MDEDFYSDDFPINWQCDGPWTAPFGRIAVSLNGERLFVMGLEGYGAISVLAAFAVRDDTADDLPECSAVGYIGKEPDSQMPEWFKGSLVPGDEIECAFLPPGECDPPESISSNDGVRRREAPWAWPVRDTQAIRESLGGAAPRFAIRVNDGPFRTAGISGNGVLVASISFSAHEASEDSNEKIEFGVELDGVDAVGAAKEYPRWKFPAVAAGDTVTLRILGPGDYDPCDERRGVKEP